VSSVTITFTFSEAVSGFSDSALDLTTANSDISVLSTSTVSTIVYEVIVEGANNAQDSFRLTVKSNAIVDTAGNYLTVIPSTSFTFGEQASAHHTHTHIHTHTHNTYTHTHNTYTHIIYVYIYTLFI
jgi:hypothetical protein